MATSSKPRVTRAATDQRKPQILREAAQLFQRTGYHATSMDEVAGALKLNKATIYHHFPGGKSDLLYGIALAALEDLSRRVEDLDPDADPEERLRSLVRAMIDVQLERPDETVVYHEELRWMSSLLSAAQVRELHELEKRFRDQVAAALADGASTRTLRDGDAQVDAVLLINLASSAYRTFRRGKRPDADVLTDRYTRFALDGLRRR